MSKVTILSRPKLISLNINHKCLSLTGKLLVLVEKAWLYCHQQLQLHRDIFQTIHLINVCYQQSILDQSLSSISHLLIKMNPQELIDKLVSWRGRDRPGTTSGYKCTSTLTTLNTPLPDTRGVSGGCCDKNVFTLGDSLLPCCCAWDELSFSDSEPSPRQFGDNSFGRISQFRPSDCQWDRCTRIGSSYSTAPRALEVIKQLTSDHQMDGRNPVVN